MPKEPLVTLKNVGKNLSKKTILEDINFEIFPGEVIGIIGPNGGGKSTLLKILAGFVSPTDGSVLVAGVAPKKLLSQSSGEIGLVLPEPGFYPLLTAWENLVYFGALLGLSDAQTRQRAAGLIENLKLREMDERLAALSTGTRQKLSLVRALLLEPKLVLFDEPVANLDPIASKIFVKEMRRRADEGLACVWVTHQLDAAQSVCDRVLFLNKTIKKEILVNKLKKKNSKLLNIWESIEKQTEAANE